ncbi:MAG: YajQ family cyclic di-GMP-binding protein [Legionellales bacterium]|nr:YajQ family cyclic di-GMP-binding protein [Legionellales bacterium]
MPSFDIVSEVDKHELSNALDQANREITNRFDFKGVNATFELTENTIWLKAENDFQLKQMDDILKLKLTKRGIDITALEAKEIKISLNEARQEITVRQGIDREVAKKIIKVIKDSKIKVQASVQGEQVRVTGKNRDDLQATIALIKKTEFLLPLQFNNFRD